jgi:hypothetical protein
MTIVAQIELFEDSAASLITATGQGSSLLPNPILPTPDLIPTLIRLRDFKGAYLSIGDVVCFSNSGNTALRQGIVVGCTMNMIRISPVPEYPTGSQVRLKGSHQVAKVYTTRLLQPASPVLNT